MPVPPPYPPTRRDAVVDLIHGREVADPYRWLEDSDAPETRAWIEAQNEVTFGFLGSIPGRDGIRLRLEEVWNYPRTGVPLRRGTRFFWHQNDGLQAQDVLWWQDGGEGDSQVLLDPNELSPDGTVALTGHSVSEDGRLLAYGLSTAGSDWQEWRVREVDTGRELDDCLRWVKFSGASWAKDGTGFYYSRYAEPSPEAKAEEALHNQKLYFHRVGSPQSEDVLVYERPDHPKWGFDGHVSDDGRFLVVTVWRGTDPRRAIYVLDLSAEESSVEPFLPAFDAAYQYLGHDDDRFYFHTDESAPLGRVVAIDRGNPARDAWEELVAEGDDPIESATMVADRFVVHSLHDASSRVRVHTTTGELDHEIELPGMGTVAGLGGRRSDADLYFAFTSFTEPATVYRYPVESREADFFRPPPRVVKPGLLTTKQVFVTSPDGTKVPLFLVYVGDEEPEGRPTYLTGYGGFRISTTPMFSPSALVWLEMGGVFAQACLRGGGEYGKAWHEAGTKHVKQNVFDDFIACAEHLVEAGVTRPESLAIGGGSNGGLLVGACMTQRPDLFGAALPAVGVLDMLRFHRFTIGWAWASDYGSADEEDDFPHLLAYSPLHNVEAGTRYPATLITTGDHDDRVVPAHSFKFAAAVQAAQAGDAPILIRIETRAGHGMGKPTSKVIEEAADRWAFLTRVLEWRG